MREDDEVRNYMLYQKLVYKIENDSQFEKSARNIVQHDVLHTGVSICLKTATIKQKPHTYIHMMMMNDTHTV